MSVYSGPEIPNDGLVLNLDGGNARSYSGSGTTWNDVSGNSNTGTLINGPTYDSAYGGSLVFDGVNDYVSIGNAQAGNFGTSNFSINVFFKFTSTGASSGIVCKSIGSTPTIAYGWLFNIPSVTTLGFATATTNSSWGSSGSYSCKTTNSAINDGRWHMGTIVGDRTQNNISMYIDGTLQTLQTYVGGLDQFNTVGNITNTYDLVLGNESDISHTFNGNIAQASIYNRALSAEEVKQLYNATKNRFAPPPIVGDGLVLNLDAANFRSYSGTGTTWNDLSGNGNNLTLSNSPTWNNSGYFSTGSTGYFTGAGSVSIPTGNSPYTMICWVRVIGSWVNGKGIISIGGFGATNKSNALRTYAGSLGNFSHYWWGNDLTIENNNAGLSVGTWFMATAQFDGTTRRVWANTTNVASDTPTLHDVTSTTIQVARTYSTEYLQSDVAVAQIYNRALSAQEIQQNFNALRGRYGL